MNYTDYFQKALSYENYVSMLGENYTLHQLHYSKFSITPDTQSVLNEFKLLKILVITEPWCGDSLAVLPVIRRISEQIKGSELRILLRDQHLELMKRFLSNGSQAIPKFLFLNPGGDLLFHWGSRPRPAQQIFEDHREAMKQGTIAKGEVLKKIRNYYSRDKGQEIIKEIVDLIRTKYS